MNSGTAEGRHGKRGKRRGKSHGTYGTSSDPVLYFVLMPSASAQLLILQNLLSRELRHVVALIPSAIPCHRPCQRAFDSEPWFPSEFYAGPTGVQPQNMILVHAGNRVVNPRRTAAPHLH